MKTYTWFLLKMVFKGVGSLTKTWKTAKNVSLLLTLGKTHCVGSWGFKKWTRFSWCLHFFFFFLLLLEAKFYWREIDYLMVVRKVFAVYIWLIEVSMRNQKCHWNMECDVCPRLGSQRKFSIEHSLIPGTGSLGEKEEWILAEERRKS